MLTAIFPIPVSVMKAQLAVGRKCGPYIDHFEPANIMSIEVKDFHVLTHLVLTCKQMSLGRFVEVATDGTEPKIAADTRFPHVEIGHYKI